MSYIELETFRGVERLITIFFGGLSIYWGFKLFDRTYQTTGALDAKGGGISLSLRRVGPGVFFAVFGMAVLISGLNSPLDILRRAPPTIESKAKSSPNESASQPAQAGEHVVFGQGGVVSGRENRLFDSAVALKNAIAYLSNSALPDQPRRRFLVEQLRATKTLLLEELYKPEEIQTFRDRRILVLADPTLYKKMPETERVRFEQMRSVIEE